MILRIYVPTDQSDPQAGVPLPTVTLETPVADVPLSFEGCSPAPPSTQEQINEHVAAASLPEQLPALGSANRSYGPSPGFTRVFDANFSQPITDTLPPGVVPPQEGKQLANADFPYLISYISRAHGRYVAVRLRTPSFPDTVRGDSVAKRTQVRYWSVCSFSSIEQGGIRTYGCRADFQVKPDRRGFVYLLFTDTAHRPSNITRQKHTYWLPTGPSAENNIFYRVGIPARRWKQSPLHIDQDRDNQFAAARHAMKSYYPRATYCPAPKARANVASCFERA